MIHFALITLKLEMDKHSKRIGNYMFSILPTKEQASLGIPRANDLSISGEILAKKRTLQIGTDGLDEDQKKAFEWCKQYVTCLPGTYIYLVH